MNGRSVVVAAVLALCACAQPLTRFAVDAGSDAGPTCGSGMLACFGACANPKLDDANCGGCGNTCGTTQSCAGGMCYPDDCPNADCAADQVCVGGLCKEKACVDVTCSAGFTCYMGVCQPESCDGTACTPGSVCLSHNCTDVNCIGVMCPPSTMCQLGTCNPVTQMDGGMDGGTCKGADGGAADVTSDPNNCGLCMHTCATPMHSAARCKMGMCGRGPCDLGFFDFDPAVFGCEATCTGVNCTLGDGGMVVLTVPPLAETGAVFSAAVSGGAHGDKVQTSSSFTNVGQLGEPTPPNADGTVEQTSSSYKNIGGFNSALRQP